MYYINSRNEWIQRRILVKRQFIFKEEVSLALFGIYTGNGDLHYGLICQTFAASYGVSHQPRGHCFPHPGDVVCWEKHGPRACCCTSHRCLPKVSCHKCRPSISTCLCRSLLLHGAQLCPPDDDPASGASERISPANSQHLKCPR